MAYRLDPEQYCLPLIASITIRTENRRRVFILENQHFFELCIEDLKKISQQYGWQVYVFTFMPDHLHLCIGHQTGNNLQAFIRQFKQSTAFRYKALTGEVLWQRSYFDRILRSEESLEDLVMYIAGNPGRDRIVSDPLDYPFTGSFVFNNLSELFGAAHPPV